MSEGARRVPTVRRVDVSGTFQHDPLGVERAWPPLFGRADLAEEGLPAPETGVGLHLGLGPDPPEHGREPVPPFPVPERSGGFFLGAESSDSFFPLFSHGGLKPPQKRNEMNHPHHTTPHQLRRRHLLEKSGVTT